MEVNKDLLPSGCFVCFIFCWFWWCDKGLSRIRGNKAIICISEKILDVARGHCL